MTRAASTSAAALSPRERRWAEALFAAILGPLEDHGLPAFASIDLASFYEAIDRAPGPMFAPGLRAMVAALTFWPLTHPRFRRPFHALDARARLDCVEAMAASEAYVTRQMLTTLKMLACFAYFENAAVRARSRATLDAPGGAR